MSFRYLLILGFILCTSCGVSVKKYNERINTLHSAEVLKKEVDISYKKLKQYQPLIYQYIPKEELDYAFDSLKNSIKTPMKSQEFALQLMQVVNRVHQGHNYVSIPKEKLTKKQEKDNKYKKFEPKKIYFDIASDTVYVKKQLIDDSLIEKAQLLKVDSVDVNQIMQRGRKYLTSDGYNTTLFKYDLARSITFYYGIEKPRIDSVEYTFLKNDSIFTRKYRRFRNERLDSIQQAKKAKKAKEEKEVKEDTLSKKELKEKRKKDYWKHKKYGYDYETLENMRSFDFIGENRDVGYMKIKRFRFGRPKYFYEEVFKKMDSAQSKNLIIDLRSNPGGRLSEIDELYGYFVDEPYTFLNSSIVSSRSSVLNSYYGKAGTIGNVGYLVAYPFVWMYYQLFKIKKKDDFIYYKTISAKEKPPKKYYYDGHIYVLIDGLSFSASSLLCTSLSNMKDRVTFIGEESGGDFNGTVAGTTFSKTLKNSQVKINYGVMYIDSPIKRQLVGRGTFPDVAIQTTYSDVLNDRDAEIEWVLEDIRSNTSP